jgi:hypothetical protein
MTLTDVTKKKAVFERGEDLLPLSEPLFSPS